MTADPRMHKDGAAAFAEDIASASDRAALLGLAIALRTVAQALVDRADAAEPAISAMTTEAWALAEKVLPADAALRDETRRVILAALRLSPTPRPASPRSRRNRRSDDPQA